MPGYDVDSKHNNPDFLLKSFYAVKCVLNTVKSELNFFLEGLVSIILSHQLT